MIKATILADSKYGLDRITTFELEYPRWVHAEVMTHRLFSRNAASSRAIPVKTTAKQIKENPEEPIIWGKNVSGMQSSGELSPVKRFFAKGLWKLAAKSAATFSIMLSNLGVHKQWANRVSEYAQTYKVVVTATEYDNFFHLRNHKDAQPEIKELAALMYEELQNSTPNTLKAGEWHLPYIHIARDCRGNIIYLSEPLEIPDSTATDYNATKVLPSLSLEEAKKVSASSCAQVSYRRLDTSLVKAEKIFDMLIQAEIIHASPFEHLATPINKAYDPNDFRTWQKGVTHMDRLGYLWSGNFKGWVQYRHLIPNNTCTNYKG